MTSSAAYSKVGPRGARRPPKSEWLWLRESAAWLASCLLLVCIVVILSVYQNKPRPTLHWGITLNALIAIIIKLGLAFLIVPLSAAVGQWKWMRVRTSRSLEEFSAISDAAQSPWASIMLLVRFRGGCVFLSRRFNASIWSWRPLPSSECGTIHLYDCVFLKSCKLIQI